MPATDLGIINLKFKMKNSIPHSFRRFAGVPIRRLSLRSFSALVITYFSFFGFPWLAQAFPPAPDGIIYGLVKDQYGTPLVDPNDKVILQTPGGVQLVTPIQAGLAVGVNYALHVAMDAGVQPTPDLPNALTTGSSYKLYVVVGSTTNLPLEMEGTPPSLGKPAQMTLQNLTVGGDVNGDGIPDAWELLFLQEIGVNIALANLNTNVDYAHDGRTLWQEYLLGNYPYNPTNQFAVNLVSQNSGSAVLAFTTMTARTYSAFGSPDLSHWTQVAFTIPAAGPTVLNSYYSQKIQPLQIQTVQPTNAPQLQFFRLQLQ